jgi:hypothetical protein
VKSYDDDDDDDNNDNNRLYKLRSYVTNSNMAKGSIVTVKQKTVELGSLQACFLALYNECFRLRNGEKLS